MKKGLTDKNSEFTKMLKDTKILDGLTKIPDDSNKFDLFKANDFQVINEIDMEKKYDKCVLCGKDTEYPIDYPIDYRHGYVEGAGQTCPNGCENKMVTIPESFFTENPNDIEFASKVKKYYFENYKK